MALKKVWRRPPLRRCLVSLQRLRLRFAAPRRRHGRKGGILIWGSLAPFAPFYWIALRGRLAAATNLIGGVGVAAARALRRLRAALVSLPDRISTITEGYVGFFLIDCRAANRRNQPVDNVESSTAIYATFRNDMCHFVTKAQDSCSPLWKVQAS